MWSPLEHSASSVAAMALMPAWRAIAWLGWIVRHDWPTRCRVVAAVRSVAAQQCEALQCGGSPQITKLCHHGASQQSNKRHPGQQQIDVLPEAQQ